MKKPKIVSRETLLPVSVKEFIFQLRASDEDYPLLSLERLLLEERIKAACQWVENYTGQTLIGSELVFSFNRFPAAGAFFEVMVHPAISVLSIDYDDIQGQPQSLALADLDIDLASTQLIIHAPDGWPASQQVFNAVRVRVQAGLVYTSAQNIVVNELPSNLKMAILLLATHYHEQASAVAPITLEEIPMGVTSLCNPERLHWL
ncbi:MAG: hypothetical protein KTR20_12825 [Cellvibrionaceae bacterium]|nr:hypothetical protein [Cellvibrionaceae bacterium]